MMYLCQAKPPIWCFRWLFGNIPPKKGKKNYFKMFVYFRVPTVPRSGDDYLFMGHDSQKLIDCIVQLEREVQTAFMQKNRFVL